MKLVYLLAFLTVGINAIGQSIKSIELDEGTSDAVVWRGFEFRWKQTNHRINQFGSLIELDLDSIRVHNTAGSGSQGDTWQFNNHLSYVKSENLIFHTIRDTVIISGALGESITGFSYLNISHKNKIGHSYHALLNGIHISSAEGNDPDKLMDLSLNLSQPIVQNDQLKTELHYSATFNCNAPLKMLESYECNDDRFEYVVVYDILLVSKLAHANYQRSLLNSYIDSSCWNCRGGSLYKTMRLLSSSGLKCKKRCKKNEDKSCKSKFLRNNKKFYENSSTIESNRGLNDSKKILGITSIHLSVTSENHIMFWSSFAQRSADQKVRFMHEDLIGSLPDFSLPSNAYFYYHPWEKIMRPKFMLFSFAKKGYANTGLDVIEIPLSEDAKILDYSIRVSDKYNICVFCDKGEAITGLYKPKAIKVK